MLDKYITILRAKLDELRRMLEQVDLPAEKEQAIYAELKRMEEIIAKFE